MRKRASAGTVQCDGCGAPVIPAPALDGAVPGQPVNSAIPAQPASKEAPANLKLIGIAVMVIIGLLISLTYMMKGMSFAKYNTYSLQSKKEPDYISYSMLDLFTNSIEAESYEATAKDEMPYYHETGKWICSRSSTLQTTNRMII